MLRSSFLYNAYQKALSLRLLYVTWAGWVHIANRASFHLADVIEWRLNPAKGNSPIAVKQLLLSLISTGSFGRTYSGSHF